MYQGLHDRQALRRVLVDDAEATPMYVLRDMAQATLTDTAAQDRLLRGLFDALHHQLQKQASTPALYTSHSNTQLASPHILYKALHALRVLCETGHPSVQSQLQRVAHTEVLRALTSFRGVPDAACGDAYNARVRSEANAVITAAFAPPRALPPPTTTASSQQQQHVSRSGSSNGDDHVTADTMMQRRGTAGSNSSTGGSSAVLEQLAHVTRDALSLLTQHEALRAQQGGVGAHDYVYERAAQQQRGGGSGGSKSNTTVMTSPLTHAGGRRGAAMMYTSGGTGSGFQPITLHTQTHGSNNSADTKQTTATSPLGGSVAAAAAAVTNTKPTRTTYDVHDDSNDAYSADRNNNNNSSNSSGGEQSQQHAALARLVRTTTSTHASLSRVELSSFVHACHDRLMHEEQQQRQQQQHNNSDELLVAVGGNDDDPLAQLTMSYNTAAATTTTTAQKDDASASHALCEALAGQLNMHVAWQQRLNALLCIEALLQSTLNSNSSSMRDERAVVAMRCAQCVRDYFVAHRDCVERLAHVAQATLRQRARALLARELGGIDDSDAHAERNTPHGDHDGAAAGGGGGSSCSPCASKTATPLSLRGMTVRRTAGRGGGGNSGVATTAVAPPHSAALVTPQTRQQQQPMLEALFAGDTTTHVQTIQQKQQQQQQPYVSTEELFGSVLPAPATTAAPATMCLPHAAQQQTQEQRRQRRPSQAALAEAEALMRAQLSAQPLQHS